MIVRCFRRRVRGTLFKLFPRIEAFRSHSHIKKAYILAHRLLLELDSVGVTDDTATDGVGQDRVVQTLISFTGVVLRQKVVDATLFLASTSSSTSRDPAFLSG